MSDRKRAIDPGILLALALALIAASPFLAQPGLPRDTDAELHVFRAAEVAACWQQSVLYPRWAPDFYFGYGYPIFNYYAPLTYHLASLFALLPGLDIVSGVKAVFVLALLLGGLGSYLLTRELFGPEAGVVAAAAFVTAPYLLFIDPHARGDLAEHFAVGLLPLALFFLRRLVRHGGRGPLIGTTLSVAALLTSHNLLGVVGLALLLASWGWQTVVEKQRDGVGRGLLGIGLGVTLSAFFWLPLLIELNEVQLSVTGGHFDFRHHFVAVRELLAPSILLDHRSIAPRYRFNLGIVQWVLALTGTLGLLWRPALRRRTGFFALASGGLLLLITPASHIVWEAIPTLAYFQFPWRFLGPTATGLAALAGSSINLLPRGRWRTGGAAVTLLATLVLALPLMFPPPWAPDFGDTSPAGIVDFELQGKVVGTTSTGDFLPRQVQVPLHPEPTLIASYHGPGPVDKVNRAVLPEGTEVDVLEHGPTHDRFHVSGEHHFVFRLYTILFPGWHAYVDGEEVEIEPGQPEGFITFWVEPGEHDLLVRLENTAPRRAGWGLAAGGLMVLALALVLTRPVAPTTLAPASRRTMAWLSGAIALFLLFKLGLVDHHDTWFRYTSGPGEARAAQHTQHSALEGGIDFLGFDLSRQQVRAGEELQVVLYWEALEPQTVNYQSFVHLMGADGRSWGQSDALNPGGLPTTRWPQGRYVWDLHRVVVRPDAPPGRYTLAVGLYTLADGQRLPVLGAKGEPAGNIITLEVPVEVLPAR